MKHLLFSVLLCSVATIACADDVNHQQIIFQTKNGQVVFMHTDHQIAEKDCSICHPAGKTGKIPGFSNDMAHKLCIDCHKTKGGPTACNECHEKQ